MREEMMIEFEMLFDDSIPGEKPSQFARAGGDVRAQFRRCGRAANRLHKHAWVVRWDEETVFAVTQCW